MTVSQIAKGAGLCLVAPLLLLGAYLAFLQLTGNVHEVVPGQFYRSAQLSKEGFDHYIETYHIRTVINLRGAKPGAAWYEDELAAARAHGVTHVDFPMSASKELTPEQSFKLVSLLRTAQGPILVHCKNGADRTGLASVMYLQQVANVDERTAEWQLTPLFGHLNIPFTGAYAMDDSWEDFEKLIGLPS
ncbi:tyrosine-protein phosphatase [Allorhizobium pseudoryzae]|uniref:tyrosine-protein phosphatase n=1 Tax=Allorhizobium pseudoryzae TaxID=379684 RepID=UPI003D0858E8